MRISIWTGGSPGSGVSAELGMVMGKSDALDASAAPVTIPSSTGTNFSWFKNLGLECTGNAGNTISNRRIHYTEGIPVNLPSGMFYYWLASASYSQSAAPDTDAGTDGATPSGYTDMTDTAVQYDAADDAAAVDGAVNGDYLRFAIGIDSTYAGGPGSGISGPDIRITYDES